MILKVQDLLKLPIYQNAQVYNDEQYLNRAISQITILENPTIANSMSGGEVILTSLYPIKQLSEQEQKRVFQELSAKKISAIIIKESERSKDIINKFIKYIDFSIIYIDSSLSFVDVLYPSMEILLDDKISRLTYYKEIHERFMNLIVNNEEVDEIIKTLYKLINLHITLLSNQMILIATTSSNPIYMEKNQHSLSTKKYLKFPIYEIQCGEKYSTVIPIPLSAETFYLLIESKISDIDDIYFHAIEQGIHALIIKLERQLAIEKVESKYKKNIHLELVQGNNEVKEMVISNPQIVGSLLTDSIVVSVLTVNYQKTYSYKEKMNIVQFVKSVISKYNDTQEFIIINGEKIITLWNTALWNGWKEKLHHIYDEIISECNNKFPAITLKIGIGSEVSSILECHQSFTEAKDVLEMNTSTIAFIDDLYFYRLILQIKDKDKLLNFVPKPLNVLKKKHLDLFKTLNSYLNNNQNIRKTAEDLGVHAKTVSYRLEKIKEVVLIDLSNANEILNLTLGLKILEYVK